MLVYLDRPKDAVSFEDGLILHRCGIDLQLVHRLRVGRVPKVYSLVRDRIARTTRVPARANRMIVLLNSNRSWHSVPKVQPARQIRIVVSSSVDIWA
jgi:hypothetical protein